jgi:hypothetical protein
MQKSGINQTQGIMLSHCLQSDRLPKKPPKITTYPVLISIIQHFYRVFIYQLFFYLARTTGKMYL